MFLKFCLWCSSYLQLKMWNCLFMKHVLFKIEKCSFFFLNTLISLVLSQNFGNMVHKIAQIYVNIIVGYLWKLEKSHSKQNKVQLDINFSINCKNFGVFTKFINVYLLNVHKKDVWNKEKTPKECNTWQIWERNDFDIRI